ncbi:hypothetical protein H6F76_18320 [Leptolyngbya sp. FACHB-321]|uniref:hypothetical protein n=1 Tax=Leptolyngbya sp. FACHB-321 TaxID=2692807 RepID=UPI001684D61E|nr:hypothetical protein [Leptolyngbya sp. FACHB-321]MBD2036966.1 hypothetical protein [Leptolyngbya sp. FACHB-321]
MAPDPIDMELEALKTALFEQRNSGQDEYSSSISASIRALQTIASGLEEFEHELKRRCLTSKTKAVEADKYLKIALAKQEMGQVFQHSIDKTVHLRLAKAMENQASKIEMELIKLKVNLDLAAKEIGRP